MNIDSINYHPSGVLKYRSEYGLRDGEKCTGADLCGKNTNRGYYSGSFTGGLNVAAAKNSDKLIDKIFKLCDSHTVIAQNLVALVLAACLRPIAIMSLPGKKDKDDKIYASGHAIASGVIGFAFSTIVMYPLGVASSKFRSLIKDVSEVFSLKDKKDTELTEKQLKSRKNLFDKYKVKSVEALEDVNVFKKLKKAYKVDNLGEIQYSKAFEKVTKILDMAPDTFVFGILKAMLTVALIPPILKYVFGLEKGKTSQASAAQESPHSDNIPPCPIVKPDITKFAGGLK